MAERYTSRSHSKDEGETKICSPDDVERGITPGGIPPGGYIYMFKKRIK